MTPTEVLLGANAVSAQAFGGHVMAYRFRIFRLGRLRHAVATYRPNDNPFDPKRFRAMTFNEPPACSLRCRRSQAKALERRRARSGQSYQAVGLPQILD
jgi:hypothetical protein